MPVAAAGVGVHASPGAKLIVGLDPKSDVLRAGDAWLFVRQGNPVWEGRVETLDDFKERYDINDVFWVDEFDKKLDSLVPDTVYTFSGASITIPESARHDTSTLRSRLATSRTTKVKATFD